MSLPSTPSGGLASVKPSANRGLGYRHQSPGYDPLDGQGARINGGRFNPPDSFPVLYLCTSRRCAVAEFERLGKRQVIGAIGLLPRELYEYQAELSRVLDLRSPAALATIGIQPSQLISSDWAACQRLGEDAHTAGFQAIRSPSATGEDEILAVFPELVGASGRLEPKLLEVWTSLTDL